MNAYIHYFHYLTLLQIKLVRCNLYELTEGIEQKLVVENDSCRSYHITCEGRQDIKVIVQTFFHKQDDVMIRGRFLHYQCFTSPDRKFHGANMGPIWGRQDPGGRHVGHMNFAIWEGNPPVIGK